MQIWWKLWYYSGYPAYGHAIGKREAEAEADPSYLVGIGGYGYGGYGYGGYGLGLPIVHAPTVAVGGKFSVIQIQRYS